MQASISKKKTYAALISVLSNTILVILKLLIGIITNSISIISEAAHSGIDLMASFIAFIAVKKAEIPPDETHPFGHGKIENLSGIVEGGLIFVAVFLIALESIKRIFVGRHLHSIDWGLGIMVFSSIINIFVSTWLFKVSKETDSIALEADAYHLRTDVYTSLGVLAGLLAIRLTKIEILDPLIALGVAIFITKAAWEITKRSAAGLMDQKLPVAEEMLIRNIINKHYRQFVNFHSLRSRKSGSERYIDLHLVLSKDMTLKEAHNFCNHLEKDIARKLARSKVMIHVEPCNGKCERCQQECQS
ncbi:MAG: cation diffusion facilitator family transporter [bacterium]